MLYGHKIVGRRERWKQFFLLSSSELPHVVLMASPTVKILINNPKSKLFVSLRVSLNFGKGKRQNLVFLSQQVKNEISMLSQICREIKVGKKINGSGR